MIFVGECCWVWAKSGIPVGGPVIRQGVKEVFFFGGDKETGDKRASLPAGTAH